MRQHDPVAIAAGDPTTVTGLFRAQVARTPQSVALDCGQLSLSYADLDGWSDALARRLVAAGVRRGDLVGIRGVRCAETVVGLLGILKAGAAYLPLSPSDPYARLQRIIEDAAPVAVVEPEAAHPDLPFAGPVLNVNDRDDDGGVGSSVDLTDLTGEDLAYVCYTSGSTGQPKGVMIPHRGVVRLVRNTNYIDIRPDDVFLQFAPLSFDASTFEIWGALLNGAKLAIYPHAKTELSDLGTFIREKGITTLWLTSALFNRMVDCEIESLLGVRHLLAGGDILSVPHVKKLLSGMPAGHNLVNGYGPTENTTFTTCHRMDRTTVVSDRISIGVPVTATEVIILDSYGAPVPAGVPGEMLIGGTGLALGYLNSPGLDAEKFVEVADAKGEKRRFYRSGDLGAWNADGTIDFRGRLDDQVKIRGFRVEPGEIEAALRELPGVRDAVVAIRERSDGEKTLAAFVVCAAADAPDAAAIKAELTGNLPDYMVPAELHLVQTLPVTPHGKVDRRALLQKHAYDVGEADMGADHLAPRDLLEHRLAGIWSRLFGRERIGRNDNFFELGGHSLLAAQMAHEVEKLVGHRFPIALVFQAQTIAELAAMIEGEDWAPAWSSLVPLRVDGDKPPLFFVHGYGGDVYAFVHLVRSMEKGRPVYGLQAAELSGGIPPHETMEQMAAHYAKEIRSLQPVGPYHVAGYSLGGWIAYAVAQELRRGGHEVAFLGLFDTFPTARVSWHDHLRAIVPDLAERAAKHLRALRRIPWSGRWSYLAGPLRTFRFILTRGQGRAGERYVQDKGWKTDHFAALHARYRPLPYEGKAEIFVASEGKHFAYSFWKRMIRGRARFHKVAGSHDDMLSASNCPALARELESLLQPRLRDDQTAYPFGHVTVVQPSTDLATTVHGLVEEQAAESPHAVAVESGDDTLSYRELNVWADILASKLAVVGAGSGEVVGIYAPMSANTLVGVLAILKTGAAYLPVDMALPPARRAFLLQDSRCKIVLVPSQHESQLRMDLCEYKLSPLIVDLDAALHSSADSAEFPRASSARPESLAYVLYTSGSTGRPKGVEMPHRALVNLLAWQASISPAAGSMRTLQFANLGFDVSFQEIFSTWISGGTLVLMEGAVRRDPEKLLRFVDQRKIERLFLPFVALENLVEAAGRWDLFPCSIKEVFVAGEQLRVGSGIRRFFGRIPAARLWNHYGPTETHVVTGHMLEGDPGLWPDLPPIGRPVDNCEIELLDEALRPVPAGVPGEIYVSGVPLANGYRNNRELTAERFFPSERKRGGMMYKTGDIARKNPDGTFQFLGRSDFQVKIRGHRIEPGEIEVLLAKHPDVASCVVLPEEGPSGRQLAAFVVPRDGADLLPASLRRFLGVKLPDYMIPTRFALLPELPLNANGKVDREALGQMEERKGSTGSAQPEPRHDLEFRLVEMWNSLLSRQDIGIHDNFFELGGHSLLVAFCCAEIEKELGLRVPLALFFENPTIAGLMDKLRDLPLEPMVVPAEGRYNDPPASFTQEGMWFLQQCLPQSAAYNQALAWRFSGAVDKARLQLSLESIMRRHEVLRCALVYEQGLLVQRVSHPEQLPLPWREAALGAEVPSEEHLRAEARRPFDLAVAPLWRCLWISVGPEDHILMLTFHHSVIDEWSMRLLVGELERIYAGSNPETLHFHYTDYAAWERSRLGSGRLETGRSYWSRQLAGLPPPLEWSLSAERSPLFSGGGMTHSFQLDSGITSKLRSLAREEGTTSFVVMLAAFQLWLHRISGEEDIIVGTPFAERSHAEFRALIGCFLNTLPIRTKFLRNESFCDVLRKVRGAVLAAFDHADFPYAKMVELAAAQRGTTGGSLFQTMFVLLEQMVPAPRLGGIGSQSLPCETRTAKFDLTLFINAEGEAWDCRLEYSTDLFCAADAARMAREMKSLFAALAENPSANLP